MMNLAHKTIGILCAFALAAPTTAYAQQEGMTAIQRLELSARLFAYSVEENDPISAISAAKIRKSVDVVDEKRSDPNIDVVDAVAPLSWQDMLETASSFGRGRDDIEALIEDVRAATTKGLSAGAIRSNASIVARGKRKYFDMRFEGGAYAEIYSQGHSAVNVDMFVYNARGELVCSQTDPSPISLCGWTPAKTEDFTIIIENKSDKATNYSMVTN